MNELSSFHSEMLNNLSENPIEGFTEGNRRVSVIMGSGFESTFDLICGELDLRQTSTIPYSRIIHHIPSVEGHTGELRIATCYRRNTDYLFWMGRVHYYEVLDPCVSTFQVTLSHILEVSSIISTCSSGYLLASGEEEPPRRIFQVSDQVSFMPINPLIGRNDPSLGEQFPPSHNLYTKLDSLMAPLGFPRAIYSAGIAGPMYETALEAKFLWKGGVRLVGMSLVNEAILANYFRIPLVALSFVSNIVYIDAENHPNHEEVLETARSRSSEISSALRDTLRAL